MIETRFEVLGPLRAWSGDAAVALGPIQRRVVLGVLLLHANRPLGREQLIEAVWGSDAPAYSVNLIQKHVSGLRRALRAGPEGAASRWLVWTEAGYVLTVGSELLDLAEFDAAVARARAARAAGALSEVATSLRAALALWRGPVCDGLTSPYLDAERDRRAEQRLNLIEERIEVDLALGHDADLVGELRQLVTEHPLRERLRGLLMLSLYRSGRPADALSAYRDARRHLREELGVEPGPRLRDLHQKILANAPELAPPTAVGLDPAAPHQPTPAQLPHGQPHFSGRAAALDRLHGLLRSDGDGALTATIIAVITGTAGVGKTALAVHWAHQVRHRYPGGQLYVNLRGVDGTGPAMEPGEAIRGFLDAFGVPPQRIPVNLAGQAALYRSLLADRRVLVLLDNAADAEQVRPLLPGSPGCLVVVTSRDQLRGLVAAEGAHPLVLDLLSGVDSRRLLARRLGEPRLAAEPDAVDDIVASCARLPLALTIVAARAATNPRFTLGALARELREAGGGLDAFHAGDVVTDVRTVFSWSLGRLGGPARRLFRLLGLHPGDEIGVAAAASLAGLPVRTVRTLLAELTAAHLVTESAPGRFTQHDLLRAYATEQAHDTEAEAERHAAVRRVVQHYGHAAHVADGALHPRREPAAPPPADATVSLVEVADHDQALAWFDVEHPTLLATVDQASRLGFDEDAARLARDLVTFLNRRGHWQDLVTVQLAGLAAAIRLGDLHGQASAHRGLARAYAHRGQHADAHSHLGQALALHERLGNLVGQADAHYTLARVLYRQERYPEALDEATRALDLHRDAGHRTGQAEALNAIGWFHVLLGDHRRALGYCREALALHEELGDRHGQAATWDSLGFTHHHLGDHREATSCHLRAIDLWRAVGDRYGEAETLTHLGEAQEGAGEPDAAHRSYRQALSILDELAHPDADDVRTRLRRLDSSMELS